MDYTYTITSYLPVIFRRIYYLLSKLLESNFKIEIFLKNSSIYFKRDLFLLRQMFGEMYYNILIR